MSSHVRTTRRPVDLRRWADLTIIYRAFRARLPGDLPGRAGLKDVAELCKRDLAARPVRDGNVCDQLLLIAVEWDLDFDRLDQQSEACLRAIADLLRGV